MFYAVIGKRNLQTLFSCYFERQKDWRLEETPETILRSVFHLQCLDNSITGSALHSSPT